MAKSSTFGAEFGLLVKRRRAERGNLSQVKLANVLNKDAAKGTLITNTEISRLESGHIANPHESTVLRYCEALGIRADEVTALRLAPPLPPKGQLDLIAEINAANRAQMNDLAVEFLIETPENHSDPHLRQLLLYKAQELRELKESVAKLRGKSERLDNLLPMIEAAIAERSYAQARQLINDAREIRRDLLRAELETDASLLETTARIDLFENNLDAAYSHYKAAAASFAAIDPMEPIRRRDGYAATLYNHGLRFGGTGLLRAIDLWQTNLTDLSQTEYPLDWAHVQNNLAVALGNQAARVEGAAGAYLLAQAVAAYRQALQVYTRQDHPVDWAATQNNLAVNLDRQAARVDRATGAGLLAQAVDEYKQALQVRTREDHQVDWAMTQNNLAIALRAQAAWVQGAAGAGLLAQAVAAFRQALTVFTRDNHPVQWAATQNNLAVALRNQVARVEGTAEADVLAQAVAAHQQALQVCTRKDHPVYWAMTQNNLANALRDQAARVEGTVGADVLALAVAAYRQALQVYTREDHPVDWAVTQNNLANALGDQAGRVQGTAGADLLAQAVAAYQHALQVYTLEDNPVDWAMTQFNLAIVTIAIAIATLTIAQHPTTSNPEPPLRDALSHVDAALTVFDPIHMAPNHSKATALRAEILAALQSLPKR